MKVALKVQTLCSSLDEVRPLIADADQGALPLAARNDERAAVGCRNRNQAVLFSNLVSSARRILDVLPEKYSSDEFHFTPNSAPKTSPRLSLASHTSLNVFPGKFSGEGQFRNASDQPPMVLAAA
jgi:hypothetical protein